MPDVPYPITAENSEDLKRQVWELIREIFEERIGGLNIGDVFEDSGGVLTLRLGASNPCLQKVANALQLEIKSASGIQATSTGVSIKLKSAGGLDVDSTGIFISSAGYGFGTFSCPAGTNPTADIPNDTLTLTAGAGVSITGTASTDTIEIANTDGGAAAVSTHNGTFAHADIALNTAARHTQGTDTALGAVGTKNPPIDADKAVYRDSTASDALVTSTWTQIKAFLKTYFDTLYIAVTGRYRYAAALADGGTITLPTITANWPAHGVILCAHASTGVISDSAEFEFGSTGEVQLIRGTANIEAGGATAGKISLGPVVDANPVVIKNNLGGGTSVNVVVILDYN